MKKYIYISILALTGSGAMAQTPAKAVHYSEATFAAGCFWHEEALFESIKGVEDVVSGYAGGTVRNPTFEQIETGTTGHAETVNIKYDSTKISYADLLKIYVESMSNPTQLNGQGADQGQQYRSLIFYRNNREKKIAEDYILKLNNSGRYKGTITASIMQFKVFYKAEAYHQDYVARNPTNGYVQTVSIPEIQKYQHDHPALIKDGKMFR
jgi:peptide-methionine (S)-S-oxide reductase